MTDMMKKVLGYLWGVPVTVLVAIASFLIAVLGAMVVFGGIVVIVGGIVGGFVVIVGVIVSLSVLGLLWSLLHLIGNILAYGPKKGMRRWRWKFKLMSKGASSKMDKLNLR